MNSRTIRTLRQPSMGDWYLYLLFLPCFLDFGRRDILPEAFRVDIRVTTEESERSALGLGQSGTNTRGFVLSPAVPMGLISRNMETDFFFFFRCKSPFPYFTMLCCSAHELSAPFKDFSFTFWVFLVLSKSQPAFSHWEAFSVLPTLVLLFSFHNCLESFSFLISSFLVLFTHPGCFCLWKNKRHGGSHELLHKVTNAVSILLFLSFFIVSLHWQK